MKPSKTFKVISDELFAVKKAGYKLDPNSEYETDFEEILEGITWPERENEKYNMIDSFYDLDGANLCEDENGELYAVEFYYTGKPIIWKKVVPRNN